MLIVTPDKTPVPEKTEAAIDTRPRRHDRSLKWERSMGTWIPEIS
jgi:hypothetical protein